MTDNNTRFWLTYQSEDLSKIKVNVYRFKQSLDDPTFLFWRPHSIAAGEWPFIFFLKLLEGEVFPNKDLPTETSCC